MFVDASDHQTAARSVYPDFNTTLPPYSFARALFFSSKYFALTRYSASRARFLPSPILDLHLLLPRRPSAWDLGRSPFQALKQKSFHLVSKGGCSHAGLYTLKPRLLSAEGMALSN